MTHGVALCALQYLVDFLLGERYRLIGSADESRHLRRVAHHAPCIIRRYHIDEDIAGEYLLFGLGLSTILYLYLFLCGDDDIEDLIGHAKTLHALFEITRDGVFVTGIRVYRVPLSVGAVGLFRHRICSMLVVSCVIQQQEVARQATVAPAVRR